MLYSFEKREGNNGNFYIIFVDGKIFTLAALVLTAPDSEVSLFDENDNEICRVSYPLSSAVQLDAAEYMLKELSDLAIRATGIDFSETFRKIREDMK